MKKTILWVLLLIVAGMVGFSAYSGAFNKVQFSEKEMGPFQLVYVEHIGSYSEVGSSMDHLYDRLLEDGIQTTRGFGIYYDDPELVKESELRSEVGCIVEPEDLDKLTRVDHKYMSRTFREQACLVTEFPYRNQFSILLGVSKVYPALEAYLEKHKLPSREIMELYDRPNNRIYYLMPLNKPVETQAS